MNKDQREIQRKLRILRYAGEIISKLRQLEVWGQVYNPEEVNLIEKTMRKNFYHGH